MWMIQADRPNTDFVGSKSTMILHFPVFLYVWIDIAMGHVFQEVAFS